MVRSLIFVFILASLGVVVRAWLVRQPLGGRVLVSLCMISIAMYIYAYALYGACHGEVAWLTNPFACTHVNAAAFNPGAYRIGRAR